MRAGSRFSERRTPNFELRIAPVWLGFIVACIRAGRMSNGHKEDVDHRAGYDN